MASPAYEKILDVQALDVQLMQLGHRHANHPARRIVADLEAERDSMNAVGAEIDQRHHELERQRKRFEDEAALVSDRRQGIDQKLYGGEVTASKELLALQDEAASLAQQQTDLEDQELELMEQLDTVAGEQEAFRAELTELNGRIDSAQSDLTAGLAELDEERSVVEGNRRSAAEQADSTLLKEYEALWPQYDGVAVAQLANGSCDGCHIQLSAVALDRLMKLPDDAVVTCEECGRMLVR